jgi:hypothetical protein
LCPNGGEIVTFATRALQGRWDNRRAMDDRLYEDMKQFMHELTVRHERSTAAVVRQLDELTGTIRQHTASMNAALEDMRAEIRAQTQGLLQVLDHLRGAEGGG